MSDDDRMDRADRIRDVNEGRGVDDAAAGEETADDGDQPTGGSDAAGDAPEAPETDEATAAAMRAAEASASVEGDLTVPDESEVETSAAAPASGGAAGMEDTDAEVPGVAGADRGDSSDGTDTEETVRVLEFVVGDQSFCLDIATVEEIVEHESVTRVPNAPDCVSGVVDLRGQITTILDPQTFLDAAGGDDASLIVVFDPVAFESQGAIGWLVDEVSRVTSVPESAVTGAPGEDEHVEGVLDREDEDNLVVWIDPHTALDLVTGEEASADG